MKAELSLVNAGFTVRGPVIGPMAIAGVVMDEKDMKKLTALGVKDSKLLTPKMREKLELDIKVLAKDYIVLKISAKEIDEQRKRKTLNVIEAEKIAQIIKAMKADRAIIDAPQVSTDKFKGLVMALAKNSTKLTCENKADINYPIVSAASILAKVERDREIKRIKKVVGYDFASLPYDEKILIENENNIRKLIKIGKLVENKEYFKNTSIFALNPENLKIEKFHITDFIGMG